MSTDEYQTDELLERIIKSSSPEAFLSLGQDVKLNLSDYLNQLLIKYDLHKAQVIRDAHLNETFGYQIFNGDRNPSRNKVLALALSMGVTLHEARLMLAHAGVGDLYCKNRRDAIIEFCIGKQLGLARTDDELHKFGEETISDAGLS